MTFPIAGGVFDGVTDDTAAIQASEDALSAAGGGILYFPPLPAVVTGLVKKSGTIWQGGGMGRTTLKLKAGTTTNAVVSGLNAYSLFGTDSRDGIVDFSIRDMTIDGNRTGGCTSDGLGIYGWVWDLNCVEIKSANGRGWRSEYGIPGVEKHSNVQSHASKMLVWDHQGTGVYYRGPNDSTFHGINSYWNLGYNFWLAGRGTIKGIDCHAWSDGIGGRQALMGFRLDSDENMLTGCVSEGSTGSQIWIRSNANTITSGASFYNQVSPNSVTGIRLGDAAGIGGSVVTATTNTIRQRIDNCQGSAIFFDSDGGYNNIDVIGWNNGGGTGYSGAIGPSSRVRMAISGATTNAMINRDNIPLVIA